MFSLKGAISEDRKVHRGLQECKMKKVFVKNQKISIPQQKEANKFTGL